MIPAIIYSAGEKITKPGVYVMPLSAYHSQCCDGPSVSSSGLRTIFHRSAAHFWDESSLNPDHAEVKDTKAMMLGRAAHHLFLGEGEFRKHFIIRPDEIDGEKWQGNKKICKAWLAKQELAGLSVITGEMVEQIRGMAAAIQSHPMASTNLRGHIEVSLIWRDPETGIWLKSRPDCLPLESADGVDLKCVASVEDRDIASAIESRGYNQQGALVGEAFRNVLGVEMEGFSLIFAENERPHCIRVESLSPEDYDRGYHQNRAALRLLRKCLDTGEWPGPRNRDGDGSFFNLSSFARDRIDRRLQQIDREIAV